MKTLAGTSLTMLNDPTADAREQLTKALDQISQTIIQNLNQKYGDDFTDALTETKRRVDEAEYSPQATIAYLRAQGYDDDMIQRILDQVG